MEFDINGNTYSTGRIDAFKQFHISRRLAPVILAMGASVKGLKIDIAKLTDLDAVMALGPAADVIAKMSEEDVDYILKSCLAVSKRKQGDKWAALTASNGALMFQDISMPEMVRITVAVIQENLANFFPAQPEQQAAKQ